MQKPPERVEARNGARQDDPSRPGLTYVAWILWALAVIPSLGTLTLYAQFNVQNLALTAVTLLLYPTVGVLIASRRSENPLGWIFCVAAVTLAIGNLGEAYMKYGLSKHSLPAEAWLGWGGPLFDFPAFFTLFVSLCLLFPTGQLLSRRWRPLVWLAGAYIAAAFVKGAFASEFVSDSSQQLRSPVFIPAVARLFDLYQIPELILGLVLLIGSLLSLVLRFRRSHGIERLQLKWFVYVVALSIVSFLAAGTVASLDPVNQGGLLGSVFWTTAIVGLESGVPAVVAIAILRYHLYDIDRIINKTLVYGAVTLFLAGLDILLVFGFERLLAPIVSGSSLIVAGSTLAVAALIRPLRSRVQLIVDRRFYRHKYDATRILERFNLRLRDQTDLSALATEIGGVVQETMQPEHVSLWLRDTAGSSTHQ